MKYLIYLVAIVFLLGVNVGIFPYLRSFGTTPNLLLLFTLLVVFEKHDSSFFFVGFLSGLFLDFFSGAFLGTFTFSFLLAVFLLYLISKHFLLLSEVNWKNLCIMLFLSILIVHILAWLYNLAVFKLSWSAQSLPLGIFTWRFLAEIIYNLALLYPVYIFTALVQKLNLNFEMGKIKPY